METYEDWKNRYAALYAAIQAATSQKELTSICRKLQNADDKGKLTYPFAYGPFFAFKAERKEQIHQAEIAEINARYEASLPKKVEEDAPRKIYVNPELRAKRLDTWCRENRIRMR